MIFSCLALAAILPLATAVPATSEIYYHEHPMIGPGMWAFGTGGLRVYSADGKSLLKDIPKDDFCETAINFRTGEESNDCSFIDVSSDGHKYVWAAVTQGTSRVDVFSIDSGDWVGSLPTCSTPLDLDYNPLREEMWLRCAQDDVENGHGGQIDVWSVNALSSDHQQVNLTSGRPYGRSTFHSTLGNYGYATAYNSAFLYKVDVNTKEVESEFPLINSYGAYDMTYSQVNKHIYLRARVCCTCGGTDSDVGEDCDENPGYVNILTGPNAGRTNVTGYCGNTCMGTPADTIGVYEFDTVSETFVGSHNIADGSGFGADPVASPDGKYVFLLGNDGGKNVRVLRAGSNGQKASVAFDVPLNFASTHLNAEAITDFAFVGDSIVVFASAFDNHAAIVDMSQTPPKTHKVLLTDAAEPTGGRARSVEWAYGTRYVWINAASTGEHYVLEVGDSIESSRLAATVQDDNPSVHLLWVENYATRAMETQLSQSAKLAVESDEGNAEALAIAGLILATVALLTSFAMLFKLQKGSTTSAPAKLETPTEKEDQLEDMKSLASKQQV